MLKFIRTIKGKMLVSFIVLLLVPMSLVAVFNYSKSAGILESKSVEQFYHLTDLTNRQIEQYFRDIETLSMNIIESPLVQKRLQQVYITPKDWTPRQVKDEAEMNVFLSGIFKLKPGIASIVVYGNNGITDFYHPSANMLNDDFEYKVQYWFKEAANQNGKWVLSGKREEQQFIKLSDPTKHEVITFSRLVKDVFTLEPLGVLAINVRIDMIDTLTKLTERDNQLMILDKEGKTIVASNEMDDLYNDSKWLKVSSVSPYTGWTSVYLGNKTGLFKESRDIRNFIMILTAAIFITGLISAHLISTSIIKPLIILKNKMKEVERGHFHGQVVLANRDEVGELTQRFNRMLSRIQFLMGEIREKEQQKSQIELNALQSRINPHFMYNTLNALRIQAIMDGYLPLSERIEALVYLLKFSAKNKENEITIKQELLLLNQYINLMKMRNENFEIELDIDPQMENHLILSFLLQPIVENAIFHGIVPLDRTGHIHVKMFIKANKNYAIIRDNGVGMEANVLKGLLIAEDEHHEEFHFHKIGIKNVYDRLKLKYGNQADLQVSSRLTEGTEVTLMWPIITKDGAHS